MGRRKRVHAHLCGSNGGASDALSKSGGYYVFVRRALGEFIGFTVGYLDWTTVVAATALISMVVSDQLVKLFSASPDATTPVSIGLIVLLTALNLGNARATQTLHIGASVLKGIAFLLIVGGLGLTSAEAIHPTLPATAGSATFGGLFLAFQAVIATYGGWELSAYYAGETSSSRKVIPRALYGSVIVIMTVYLSMTAVLMRVLTVDEIASTPMPFTLGMERTLGSGGALPLSILMAIIMISALASCILGASRVLYALASDKLALASFARTDQRGVPTCALLVGAAFAILLIVSGTFGRILSVLALFRVLNYLLCVVSVFALRRNAPPNEDVYRTPGHPWTTLIIGIVSGIFVVSSFVVDTHNSVLGICIAIIGTPVYFLAKRRQ